MKLQSLLIALLVVLGGCGPAQPAREGQAPQPRPASGPRTLVMVVNTEVSNLATKVIGPTNPDRTTRMFNASLTVIDDRGAARPYLAESLPQLNSDTWRVFPDGRMETTWKLRPNLTWHDGRPLTAEDFVFAFRMYTAPGLAVFEPKPQDRVDEVVEIDPLTIRIRWRSLFLHDGDGFDPLPRHLLAEPFAALQQDAAAQRDLFMSQRFWTTDYVGAGPYRLTGWEPASHLEGAAFDGHALGRPKIDRVIIRLMNDENTVLTTILAGDVHLTMSQAIRFEHAMVLRREWGLDAQGRGSKGSVIFEATSTTTAAIQHRPEQQQTPSLMDVRVRRALAHAMDKEALNEVLFEGQNPIAHTHVPLERPYYPDVDRAITKYPYDQRRAEQLLTEAGFRKDGQGMFVNAAGERIQPAFWNSAGAQREQMMQIVENMWRMVGIDVQPLVMSRALERDQEARAKFPGILSHGVSLSERGTAENLSVEQIGTAANRWSGSNRGGWASPDYDRLWEAYNATLERSEQVRHFVEMMRMRSELLPSIPLHYSLNVVSHLGALRGPGQGVPETTSHWNIQDWDLA